MKLSISIFATTLLVAFNAPSNGADVIDSLNRMRASGTSPTDSEFFTLLEQSDVEFLSDDGIAAWQHLKTLHQPAKSGKELAAQITTQRNTISDLYLEYRASYDVSIPGLAAEKVIYAMSGANEYVRVESEMTPDAPNAIPTLIMSYDGRVVRRYCAEEGRDGEIFQFKHGFHLHMLQTNTNPLVLAKLADFANLDATPGPATDLDYFLYSGSTIVFEQPERFDQIECVAAAFGRGFKIYLGPEKSYALIRSEGYSQSKGKRVLGSRTDLREHQDCGSGLWLPRKVTRRQFDKVTGKERVFVEIIVTKLLVNEGIDDSLFTENIFPPGVRVGDLPKTDSD